MDLLKEKYSELLNEGEEDRKYPYVTHRYGSEIYLMEYSMAKIPKFLKYVECLVLSIYNCPRLKTLENCPMADTIYIDNCPSLKTLEGLPSSGVVKLAIRNRALQSFKGLPEQISKLALYNMDLFPILRKSLESGECKSVIKQLHYGGFYSIPPNRNEDIKAIRNMINCRFSYVE